MKQKILHLFTLRTFALVALLATAVSGAWADSTKTAKFDFTKSQTSPTTVERVTFTWTSTNIVTNNSTSGGFKASSDMTITLPAGAKLTKIAKENGNSWGQNATIKVYQGSDTKGTSVADIVSSTNEYTISSNNTGDTFYFSNSTSKNAWLKSLSITYEEVAADPYTVTLGDNSYQLKEESAGAGVTLPSRDNSNGYTFVGWSEHNYGSEETSTKDAAAIIEPGTYKPTTNVTLYPVYTRTVEGDGEATETLAETMSYNETNWNISGSTQDQKTYTMFAENAYVESSATFDLSTISKVVVKARKFGGSGAYSIGSATQTWASVSPTSTTLTDYTTTEGTQMSGMGKLRVTSTTGSINATNASSSKGTGISEVKIYTLTSASTTYYISEPVAAAVAKPVITVVETFTESTTATITCTTEGATIQYSTDGGATWQDYPEGGITITETTTITAKAVKGDDTSDEVSKTTTKLTAAGISYDESTQSVKIGNAFTTPVLNNPNSLTVTYTSSVTSVATVDATTGAVTIVGEGETVITATAAQQTVNEVTYAAATATYTLTVLENDDAIVSTFSNKDLSTSENKVTWTTNKTVNSLEGNRGIQFSSQGSDVTLSTTGVTKTITAVEIVTSTNGSNNTLGVTVGTTVFKNGESTSYSILSGTANNNQTVTFTGKAKGTVTININDAASSVYIKKITIYTSDEVIKDAAGITFDKASYTAEMEQTFTAPTVNNPNSLGGVTYGSSDTDVATVDATTGAVTLVAAGTAVIMATTPATDDYEAGEAQYTLTVLSATTHYDFVKVTEITEGGEYLIVNDANSAAFGDIVSNKGSSVGVSISDDKINTGINVDGRPFTFVVEESTNGYTLHSAGNGGFYLTYTSNSTNFSMPSASRSVTAEKSEWTITYDEETASFKVMNVSATTRGVVYTSTFAPYAYDSNAKGADNYVQLYKKEVPTEYERTVTEGNYGTICLPFGVAEDAYLGATFYKISGKKMDGATLKYIKLEEVTSLTAGYAYLFRATDDDLIAEYSGKEAYAPVAAAESGTGLTGTYEKAYIPQGMYVLKSGKVYYVDVENYVYSGVNKAYIDLTNVPEVQDEDESDVKGITLWNGDVETGVSGPKAQNEVPSGLVYNLSGQRVQRATKGVYVVEGRKVVVR